MVWMQGIPWFDFVHCEPRYRAIVLNIVSGARTKVRGRCGGEAFVA